MTKQIEWVPFQTSVPALLSFPNLIEARAVKRNGKDTGEAKFSVDIEFDPSSPDVAAIKAACVKAARQLWPDRDLAAEARTIDANGNKKQPTFLFPFKSGDVLADRAKENSAKEGKERLREWSRGKFVLTARTTKAPGLSVIKDNRLIEFSDDTRATAKPYFYTGVLGLVKVQFAPYNGVPPTGVDGVTAYLDLVVSTNKGEKLIKGGATAAEVFSGYIGSVTDENPLAGGADDLSDLGI